MGFRCVVKAALLGSHACPTSLVSHSLCWVLLRALGQEAAGLSSPGQLTSIQCPCRTQLLLQGQDQRQPRADGPLAPQPFDPSSSCSAAGAAPCPGTAQAGAPSPAQPGRPCAGPRKNTGQGPRYTPHPGPGPPHPCNEESRSAAHLTLGHKARMQGS